ncbi:MULTISPECIES: DUF4097 family beta strand repeat-containing protein [Brochothrix]|uniref:Uncharacterized protein n=3 Tax=Brochothrix thermosphacta TaxID=2756 RepID=A0A1D2LSZ7_BROTH|nr:MULTISPECIES: DUF4097 family beta strand repeat-containing protein [Brochothrix]ANZ94923.1 hypothetical protein BFC19_05765 [Brochothrix thermosphacta]ANZ96777.1 hypothetical protein BFC20_03030 [Brochothrix thermosphacta]ATF26188.1 hypothetical protein CNY62_07170 [Brochothrix thermosphacta]ATH85527.1 hypothetical protein CPF12_06755 [Brochothrix thermosphacta]MBR5525479.1 DUF4097 family beta strand repeat protein [Brochothrix sp.]
MENERKRILEFVKQGVITTEEALVLLENMAKKEGATVAEEKVNRTDSQNQEQNKRTEPQNGKAQSQYKRNDSNEWEQHKEQSTKETSEGTDWNRMGDQIGSFMNDAFKQLKEVAVPFLKPARLERHFVYNKPTASNITLDVFNGHVEVVESDNEDIHLFVKAQNYKPIKQEDMESYFFKQTSLQNDDDNFVFKSPSKGIRVDVVLQLPAGKYDLISVKSLNGNISISELSCNDLLAKSTNGNIIIGKLDATDAEIQSVNGELRIDKATLRQIEMTTVNGPIHYTGDSKQVELQTKNGLINARIEGIDTEEAKIRTTAGTIKVAVPNDIGIDGDIRSNFGKIQLNLSDFDILQDEKDKVKKHTIFSKMPVSPGNITLVCDSSAGNVQIEEYRI